MAGEPEKELKDLFTQQGLSDTDLKLVVDKYQLTTVSLFADFFEKEEVNANFRAQMFDHLTEWQGSGHVLPRLRRAWRAALELVKRRAGLAPGTDDTEPLDTSMGVKQQQSLVKEFKRRRNLEISPCWIGADQVLSRFWRCLQQRRMQDAPGIKLMPNGKDVSSMLSAPCQSFDVPGQAKGIRATFTLQTGEKPKQLQPVLVLDDPFKWLLGLRYWSMNLAIAGCYEVDQTTQDGTGTPTTTKKIMVD